MRLKKNQLLIAPRILFRNACLYLLFLFAVTTVHSQQNTSGIKLPDFTPPSPNAAELGRYGVYDIGFQTGSLNIQVPLFSLEGGQVPVLLDYSTGGIKVDQVASRAGMGWVLQAGGVIMRNVNGRPDELSTRVFPNTAVLNDDLFDMLQELTSPSVFKDTEPDDFVYNFNGYRGKFVLDDDGLPLLIPHTNLKVQFGGSSIVITAPDGGIYRFSAVERTATFSVTYGDPNETAGMLTPTAWYLSEIELPNKELISFTYTDNVFFNETGTTEVIAKTDDAGNATPCETGCPQINSDMLSLHSMQSFSKLLTQVAFRSTKINFSYIDRLDVPGDKLISTITLLQNDQLVKQATLSYVYAESTETPNANFFQLTHLRYRPFLSAVIEKGNDGLEVRRHVFEYNDINGLPWRLSFSQDHYGFFNGKFNENSVPVPEDVDLHNLLPAAKADKSVDPAAAVKGCLTKVTYPTGGSLEIEYEGNQFRTRKILPPPEAIVSASILGPAIDGQTATSPVFTIPVTGFSNITGGVLVQLGQPGDPAPVDETADLLLMEIRESPSDAFIYSHVFKLGDNLDIQTNELVKDHSYYIRITVMNADVDIRRYTASVKYISGPAPEVDVNEWTGGVRVAKTIASDGAGHTETKRIYYASLEQPDVSSGSSAIPLYHQNIVNVYQGSCSVNEITPLQCKLFSGYSNSLANVYRYGQNHVYYSNVVESIGGDNFEGGGISHVYRVQKDGFAHPELGVSFVLGVRYSNTGYLNGVELSQLVFKKNNGVVVKVKETQHAYAVDNRINNTLHGYYVNKRYSYPLHQVPVNIQEFGGFDVLSYTVNARWTYKTGTTVTDYEVNGLPTVAVQINSTYGSPLHTLVTSESVLNSKNELLETVYRYPHEMVAAGEDPAGVYAQMVSRNIVSPVIQKMLRNNGVQTGFTYTGYYSPLAGLFVPQQVQTQRTQTEPLETRIVFHAYDNRANVISLSEEQNAVISYIYDYKQSLPVAKVSNAVTADIAYTSFEADGTGYWQIAAGGLLQGGITGKLSYNIAGGAVRSGLNAATTYRVSYWSNNGVQSVSGSTGYITGALLGGWQYVEHTVQGVTAVNITGTGAIDELRLYPDNAQMISFTHDPVAGMTSLANENNRLSYFGYDAFSRLRWVKDEQGNILKRICYQYAGQQGDCPGLFRNTVRSQAFTRNNCPFGAAGTTVIYTVPADKYTSAVNQAGADWMAQNDIDLNGQAWANAQGACATVYYNAERTQAFTRNNCGEGATGSAVTYTVPAQLYSSIISQADADQKAQNDINTNGQNYANLHGACTAACSSANCSGNNKKCINGICETGIRHNVNTYQNGSRWVCEFYYSWSDGSTSEIFTQLGTSPCN
jgi:hypothetical protein